MYKSYTYSINDKSGLTLFGTSCTRSNGFLSLFDGLKLSSHNQHLADKYNNHNNLVSLESRSECYINWCYAATGMLSYSKNAFNNK